MRPRTIIALCLLCFSISCKRDTVLNGEVFVVTRGAGNYKLGAIQVRAIEADKFRVFLANKQAFSAGELRRLGRRLNELKEQLDRANLSREEALRKARLVPNLLLAQTYLQEAEAKAKEVRHIQSEIDDIQSDLDEMIDSCFRDLPPAAATAISNADGRFTLRVPSGRYVIAAHAGRELPNNKTEKYYWLLWVNVTKPEQQIIMSNHNMVTTTTLDALIPFEEIIGTSP